MLALVMCIEKCGSNSSGTWPSVQPGERVNAVQTAHPTSWLPCQPADCVINHKLSSRQHGKPCPHPAAALPPACLTFPIPRLHLPASYLLDPGIRSAMGLDIKGAIIIFDESHNIEDVCMECASMDVELSALVEAHAALSSAIRWSDQPELYRPLQVPGGGGAL